jgi:hypothetical protein
MVSDRVTNILSALALLRFMTTMQIHRLYGYFGEYGLKVTRRLLGKLESEGLVRAWQPSKYEQKIYYLTKLGANLMEHDYGYDHITTYRKSEKSLHQTYISEIYVALKSGVPEHFKQFFLNKKIGDVIPDATVYYEKDNRVHVIFIEIDTGSESLLYLRDVKLQRYMQTFSQIPLSHDTHAIAFFTVHDERKKALLRMIKNYPLPISIHGIHEIAIDPSSIMDNVLYQRIP